MGEQEAHEKHDPRVLRLKAILLVLWAAVAVLPIVFARELQFTVAGWPFGYWMAAQGAVLAFIAIVAVYAWLMRRLAPEDAEESGQEGGDA